MSHHLLEHPGTRPAASRPIARARAASALLFFLLSSAALIAQAARSPAVASPGSDRRIEPQRVVHLATTWPIDSLQALGGQRVRVVGAPLVVRASAGRAVAFNGATDGLFVDVNPLQGLDRFTLETIIEPATDGPAEQRFLHVQEAAADVRALLELRLDADGTWCLDTFLKQGQAARTLIDRTRRHAAGAWYAVALVYDGSTMAHYVNGVKEAEGPVSFASTGPGRTSIGVRQNLVSWFKGRIRTVRISPDALPPEGLLTAF